MMLLIFSFLFLYRLILAERASSLLYSMSQVGNELHMSAKKTRFTVDQKKCKKQWMHNQAVIFGCTTRMDPDGLQEKEWCRTEETDEKDWGYCDDQLDLDAVR